MYSIVMNRRNRILVLVTDSDLAHLKQEAGLVPLSTWVRAQLFPISDEDRAKELIPLLKKSIEKSEALAQKRQAGPRNRQDGNLGSGTQAVWEGNAPERTDREIIKETILRGKDREAAKAAPVDMSKILP